METLRFYHLPVGILRDLVGWSSRAAPAAGVGSHVGTAVGSCCTCWEKPGGMRPLHRLCTTLWGRGICLETQVLLDRSGCRIWRPHAIATLPAVGASFDWSADAAPARGGAWLLNLLPAGCVRKDCAAEVRAMAMPIS